MSGTAPILKELHRLRRHIKDLETKIEQAPRQLTIQQARLAKQEAVLLQAHEALQQLALVIRDKEGSVKATRQQIAKYEKQLSEAAGKKEYETLKAEITQENAIIAKLEDEILDTIGVSEEKTAQLPEVEKTTQKARDDFALFEKDQGERLQRFGTERTRALEELKATEATLPEEARIQYDRLISAKGMDSMSGVNGRTCMACYTEITSQNLGELRRGVFMCCKNCGRMMYVDS